MIKKLYWFLFVHDLNESPDTSSCDKSMPLGTKLKHDLAYLVLFSYLFYIFSPLIPLFADVIAHTFWEKEHLQTAHHAYGRNHVGLEILKSEKRTAREDATNKASQENITHTPAGDIQLPFPLTRVVTTAYALLTCTPPTTCQDIDYPPPRV